MAMVCRTDCCPNLGGNNRHGREVGIRGKGDDMYRDWEIRYDEDEFL